MSEDEALIHLGWTATLAAAAAAVPSGAGVPVRVTEQHRSEYRVRAARGERTARTHPALHKTLSAADDGIVVGDWAIYQAEGGWLTQLLPRHSLLERSREDGRRQRLVANVDTALLVMGLDGDYKPERLARYQQMAVAGGVAPVVLLTKADRVADAGTLREAIQTQAGAQTPVYVIDPRTPAALDVLAPYLQAGRTLALLGSSGVGKSSLMNSLLGTEAQRVGATQDHQDDLGRHTTTARFLRLLPGGACLIDTPGMRELKLSKAQEADDYADVHALAQQCRYSDCQHQREPGCAVVPGLTAERLATYRDSLAPKPAKFRRGKKP